MSRSVIVLLTVLATVFSLVGCNTQAKWTYPVNPDQLYRAEVQPTELTIGVLPFRESRPVKNQSATMFLYLIPLMPYASVNYERPEAAKSFMTISEWEFQVDEDLGKAAARSFENSGLFKRVYFTLGGETREADYMLRGTAHRTFYQGTIYSYGLSVFGPLLWYVGLPAGSSINETEFEFELVDPAGQVVWTYQTDGRNKITQGLFYNWGNDALHFATLTENALNEALRDLGPQLPSLGARLATLH